MNKIIERKERLSSADRRSQIINTALGLFAKKGLSGTRTKEIANEAGISETLIFQHFKTKEDLYRAALKELFDTHPLMPEVEGLMAKKDDSGVFSTLALHLIKHNREDPRIMRLAIFSALEGRHTANLFSHREEIEPPLPQLLSDYIQKRINEGAFNRVNARIAGQLFVETVFMYIADQETSITGSSLSFSDEETVETLVSIFLNGLKS
ncbi:MAG TPA: TetR/AcrR family transcriptional regulator [Dehalococcoidia bacterium]|nr:TetR/AcrR family transcriptional regulator [Dehalococcoidia bacterium]